MQTVRTDSARVRALREGLRLSVRGLATATGVHETAISHVEAGRRSFTLTDTFRVAHALGVDAATITVVTDEPAVPGQTDGVPPTTPLAAS